MKTKSKKLADLVKKTADTFRVFEGLPVKLEVLELKDRVRITLSAGSGKITRSKKESDGSITYFNDRHTVAFEYFPSRITEKSPRVIPNKGKKGGKTA